MRRWREYFEKLLEANNQDTIQCRIKRSKKDAGDRRNNGRRGNTSIKKSETLKSGRTRLYKTEDDKVYGRSRPNSASSNF